jgi:hypothetical protein
MEGSSNLARISPEYPQISEEEGVPKEGSGLSPTGFRFFVAVFVYLTPDIKNLLNNRGPRRQIAFRTWMSNLERRRDRSA